MHLVPDGTTGMACDPESLKRPLEPLPSYKTANSPAAPERQSVGWVPLIALAFLTVNCIQAVHRAHGDAWTISFVVSAYTALVLLFGCLRRLEKLPRDGGHAREEWWLKFLVWALAMFLNVMFSYRVAAMMPPVLAAVIWAVAGFTTVAAFYAFFVYHEPAGAGGAPAVPSGKA